MKLINLFESFDWSTATQADFAEEARFWEGACQDEVTRDFLWHYDPAFPIAKIENGADFLADWMKHEIQMWADIEDQPNRYDDMLKGQPINEPICIHIDERGIGRIWDGWHRTGSQALQGIQTIPAIVGVRKK